MSTAHALDATAITVGNARNRRQPQQLTPIILPCTAVCEEIVEAADELALRNDPRETSAAIANRFGLPERVIDRVLDYARLDKDTRHRVLRRMVHDAIVASGVAGNDVWKSAKGH